MVYYGAVSPFMMIRNAVLIVDYCVIAMILYCWCTGLVDLVCCDWLFWWVWYVWFAGLYALLVLLFCVVCLVVGSLCFCDLLG